MYFLGTFVFQRAGDSQELVNRAALIYSFGGLFFFTSGSYIQKRYFWEKSIERVDSEERTSIASSNDI